MPVKSQAQDRWAHANVNAPGSTGAAARDFVSASHGMKVSKLPQHVAKKPKRSPRPFGSLAPTQATHYDGDMPE